MSYLIHKSGRQFNWSTKGYKINIYLNNVYQFSTDHYKTCKAAKKAYIDKNPILNPKLIKS